jgi:CDP-diacylglycerol--glycerol-3-phosphate 3-phosphatidyltransferase
VKDNADPSKKWLTTPNVITAIRILGSPGLIILAWMDQPFGMVVWTLLLVFTEWLDGFLARRLRVASAVGARLDTIADAIFYTSLLVAMVVLRPVLVAEEMIWIAAAIISYWLSWLASWAKFRCLPSYHTLAAKGVWIVVGAGIIWLLADGSRMPFRIAMSCVVLTNLEATCITLVLPNCRVNVPSLWHAWYRQRRGG